jgi:hypothetical protein
MSFYDKVVPIDFEYNNSKAEKMNVVSVAYSLNGIKNNVWLNNKETRDGDIRKFLEHIDLLVQRGCIFFAHNWVAEGRAFISLGYNPLKLKKICNFAEHRMITNHNDKMMFGNQLIKGKIVRTHRAEYGEEPSIRTSKPEHSLAATTFKMLGKSIDLDNKDDTREIIIRADYDEVEANRDRILAYGESDIDNLIPIHKAHIAEYKRLLKNKFNAKEFISEQLLRGENMVRTAMMETVGYPINYKAVKNFAMSSDDILGEIAEGVNDRFPDIKPFTYDYTKNRYKVDTKVVKNWIANSEYGGGWAVSKKTKEYSLAREEWEKRYGDGHVFHDDCFGSQMYRYYYTKQHMNGFQSTKGKKTTFWDSVGPDLIVRPWLNPYRAQSSRFQPAATGFIPLKAAWMRSLIQPEEGYAIAAIDYGSEEFLISALWSGDMEMLKAYISGDVYLSFAKSAEMCPQDATKHSHVKVRQIAKAIVLGISYGLTKYGLAIELKCSHQKAQEYIDLFNKVYHVFHAKCIELVGERGYNEAGQWIESEGRYQKEKMIKLPCGWYMFGDNDNMRSVGNCPIQGFGASILRKAIQLCQDAGLKVMYPLHDAAYIKYLIENWATELPIFQKCMKDAFLHYWPEELKEAAANIRMDFEVWGYKDERVLTLEDGTEIQTEYVHVDERHTSEYAQFSKYFEEDPELGDL